MLALVMPCRLLLNISSKDPQTDWSGVSEALCAYACAYNADTTLSTISKCKSLLL